MLTLEMLDEEQVGYPPALQSEEPPTASQGDVPGVDTAVESTPGARYPLADSWQSMAPPQNATHVHSLTAMAACTTCCKVHREGTRE